MSSSVAAARSREQSKALLAKASSKLNSILRQTHESGPGAARRPGDQVIRRAPQVSLLPSYAPWPSWRLRTD